MSNPLGLTPKKYIQYQSAMIEMLDTLNLLLERLDVIIKQMSTKDGYSPRQATKDLEELLQDQYNFMARLSACANFTVYVDD